MSLLSPNTCLELLQRTWLECQIAGPPPTTIAGLTGEGRDLLHYLNAGWMELQAEHVDWDFMQVTPGFSLPTIAGQQIYAPTAIPTAADAAIMVGNVGSWKTDTFRVYLTSSGFPSEVFMEFYHYDDWKDMYQMGTLRTTQTQPIAFTVLPNLSLGLQCPLTGYTVIGDYYQAPIAFAVDGDVPALPIQYRIMLVYRAMMVYGLEESAPEVFNQGRSLYTPLHTRLTNSRLPAIRTGGALA